MIVHSFLSALGQLLDRRFRWVLLKGILLTLALLTAALAGLYWLVGWLVGDMLTIPLIGEVGWATDTLSWGAVVLGMVLSVFLMVPVASAMTSLFLDEVAQAVEDRHYPHLPKAESVSFYDGLRDTINFLGVLIAANIAAIFVYLLLPFSTILIFWALNGFLLGREYFTLAAMRRVGRDGARNMRRLHGGKIWLAGTLMAIPLSIPLVNLLIPVLGAATFTHLFHQFRAVEVPGQTSSYR
ncbi:MAG: EI24 domain-containing protein [Pseudomonadota bacterium]